jgi:hypothetical protein
VCGSAARTDLYGGQLAIAVPTVTGVTPNVSYGGYSVCPGFSFDNFRLPLVLAGGLGGTLQTGRTLNYLKDSEDNRKMCSLYLSLMDRFDVKLDQFGDSQTRLARL